MAEETNPVCGDRLRLSLIIKNNQISSEIPGLRMSTNFGQRICFDGNDYQQDR